MFLVATYMSLEKCLFRSSGFLIGWFVGIEAYELQIKPSSVICKYFLAFLGCLFVFYYFLGCAEALNFNSVPFVYFLILFSLLLRGGAKKILLWFISASVLPVLSSKSFVLFALTSLSCRVLVEMSPPSHTTAIKETTEQNACTLSSFTECLAALTFECIAPDSQACVITFWNLLLTLHHFRDIDRSSPLS